MYRYTKKETYRSYTKSTFISQQPSNHLKHYIKIMKLIRERLKLHADHSLIAAVYLITYTCWCHKGKIEKNKHG